MTDRRDTEAFFNHPERGAASAQPESAVHSIGMRLRTAREALGLSLADCGRALHLPIKTLEQFERDDFGASEHFVFLRGALKSYAKHLGLPPGSCDEALRQVAPVEQPALVSVARTSHPRWLLQRYGTAATYIVLTALIAVPLVLLGLRGGLQRPTARIVSLDQVGTPAMQPASAKPASSTRVATTASPDATPFRASMTPFAAIGLNDASTTPEVAASIPPPKASAAPAAAPGQHTLTIDATADCWFEITDASGNKIDSGMLHAGDARTWHSGGLLHVTLGNAGAASVTRDGQALPLAPLAHSNVARFDVFGASGPSPNN
ncbi:MAG TPA: RodZ domain-containing protein [Rhodanobacteraceae bacterium]